MGNLCCPARESGQLLEVEQPARQRGLSIAETRATAEEEKRAAERKAAAAKKAAEQAAERAKAEKQAAELEDDETFAYNWGKGDFPEAFQTIGGAYTHGHPIPVSMGPKQVLKMLLENSEYRAATPRRPGKGKVLPKSQSEGEMEENARKDAQKQCRRLIVPKVASGETSESFLRRLDAHRAQVDALIAPQAPPEDDLLFTKRCIAIKEATASPPPLILPMSSLEETAEFEERLAVAKACTSLVLPRGAHETPANFKERLRCAHESSNRGASCCSWRLLQFTRCRTSCYHTPSVLASVTNLVSCRAHPHSCQVPEEGETPDHAALRRRAGQGLQLAL